MKKEPNVVFATNKKSGIVYAYEDYPYWDSEKKQSRSKRKCIGRVDPSTEKIIPTRGRKPNSINISGYTRKFYGVTYLFRLHW